MRDGEHDEDKKIPRPPPTHAAGQRSPAARASRSAPAGSPPYSKRRLASPARLGARARARHRRWRGAIQRRHDAIQWRCNAIWCCSWGGRRGAREEKEAAMAAGLRFGGEGRRSNRGGRRRRGGPNDDIIFPFLAVGYFDICTTAS